MAATNLAGPISEYGDILTPANVAQFLATRDWTCRTDRRVDQVWVLDAGGGGRPVSVLLPRQPSFVDYPKRMREAIETIASTYELGLPELAEQVASIRADLFFIRVDQRYDDGTIPLRQASALLDSIDQMIRAAALSAHNPKTTGRGRIPDTVSEFLNEDVRMGHTKKGSFIITVAARIGDEDALEEPEELGAPVAVPSFARRTMTTLARSLDVTRRYAATRDQFDGIGDAVDQGLKLQVVQALQEIGGSDGIRSLDLSFEWAPAEPQRAVVPSHVSLDRSLIDQLPDIERRLVRRTEPERITIVGPVTELKRQDSGSGDVEESGGEVVVNAEIAGRIRRVTVPLDVPDMSLAITAFRDRLPFTAAGKIVKRGNTWRLAEPVDVDRSFLEFHLGRPSSR
ncbi:MULTISPECIES: hypothetical protein [unclassified Nocardia]|uniref:hypothetical protein n=1 Tax=unclassified Nocardia TaxID=2637762 RepID=UPI0033B78083